MAADYILQVVHDEGDLFHALTEPGVTWPTELRDFDPDSFEPGLFVISAGKVYAPSSSLTLDEMRDWFKALDGMTDKVIGGTMICKVRQPI